MSDGAADRILKASLVLFARHGFPRTSMADIARETGIARATLYLYFPDKRAVFEALAASLVDDALASAKAAWRDDAALAKNLESVVLAKDLGFFRLMNATPHGSELLAVDTDLTRRHAERLDADFTAFLTRRAGEIRKQGFPLNAFGGAKGFGAFLTTASAGLKHEARTEPDYRRAVRQLARVASAAALGSSKGEAR
ncbi:MAG: helix-turn-helix domain-containing protein [Hyphomonadaceae bacterium]|nr:helix-turn-helix domain-containing protein [Hyphomonadaceae bacterium]